MTKTHTEMADIKRMVAAAVALMLMGSLQARGKTQVCRDRKPSRVLVSRDTA